jgi:hypothetical protein
VINGKAYRNPAFRREDISISNDLSRSDARKSQKSRPDFKRMDVGIEDLIARLGALSPKSGDRGYREAVVSAGLAGAGLPVVVWRGAAGKANHRNGYSIDRVDRDVEDRHQDSV